MSHVRRLAYAGVGALGAAVVVFLIHYALFYTRAGVDMAAIPWRELLVTVMALPKFAVFGAVLGLVIAAFSSPGTAAAHRLVLWPLLGIGLGAVAGVGLFLWELGDIPPAKELVNRIGSDPAALILFGAAGAGAGLVLAIASLMAGALGRVFPALRGRSGAAGLNDVDAELKAFWSRRADDYLAQRRAGEGSGVSRGGAQRRRE